MGAYLQITPALKTKLGYGEVRGCYYGQLGPRGASQRHVDHRRDSSSATSISSMPRRTASLTPDEYFATVICGELIEHLFEDPMHLMSEINRILKPGGHVVLTTPNICSLRAMAAILQGYHPGFLSGLHPARAARRRTGRAAQSRVYAAGNCICS